MVVVVVVMMVMVVMDVGCDLWWWWSWWLRLVESPQTSWQISSSVLYKTWWSLVLVVVVVKVGQITTNILANTFEHVLTNMVVVGGGGQRWGKSP